MEAIPGINRLRLGTKIIDVLEWHNIFRLLDTYDNTKKEITKVKRRVTIQKNKIEKIKEDMNDEDCDIMEELEESLQEIEDGIKTNEEMIVEFESRISIIEDEILNKEYKIYYNSPAPHKDEVVTSNKMIFVRRFQQKLAENIDPILHSAYVINNFMYRHFYINLLGEKVVKYTRISSLKRAISTNFTEEEKSKTVIVADRLIEYEGRDICCIEISKSMNVDLVRDPEAFNKKLCDDYINYYLKKVRLDRNYYVGIENLLRNNQFLGNRTLDIDITKFNDYMGRGNTLLYVNNLGNTDSRCRLLYIRVLSYIDLLLLEEVEIKYKYYGLASKPNRKTILHKYSYQGEYNVLTYLRRQITKSKEELIKYINQICNMISSSKEMEESMKHHDAEQSIEHRDDMDEDCYEEEKHYYSGDEDNNMDLQRALMDSMMCDPVDI